MLNSRELIFLSLTAFYVGVKTELHQGSCREGFKQCEIGACLSNEYICDGIIQCPDETDEKYCVGKLTPRPKNITKLVRGACPQGFVECETGEVCLQEKYLCDGDFYCPDRSDEKFCEVVTTEKPLKTQLEQGNCIDGYVECEIGDICLQTKYVCDGEFYCPDKSDEKYCGVKTSIQEKTLSSLANGETTTETVSTTQSSDEELDPSSDEKDHDFLLSDDDDHCTHYKRMIVLVRRVHIKLVKMDQKTARHIKHLINEILMEAGMENISSLLELHKVCNNIESVKHPRRHHHKHTTTTTTTTSTLPPKTT